MRNVAVGAGARLRRPHTTASAPSPQPAPTRDSSSAPAAEEPAMPTPIVSRMKTFACATASALKSSKRVSSAWRAKRSEATGGDRRVHAPPRPPNFVFIRPTRMPSSRPLESLPSKFGLCIHFWFAVPRQICLLIRPIRQARIVERPTNSFDRMGRLTPADESRQGHHHCLHSGFR